MTTQPVLRRPHPNAIALARPMLLRRACLIDGKWVEARRSMSVVNPATEQNVGEVPNLSARQVSVAVAAAHRALPAWRACAAQERAEILGHWHDLIQSNRADLALILSAEQGKPLREADAEIRYAAAYVRWFAEEARRVYGETIPGPDRNQRLTVIHQSVGVVATITPWNFPAAMIARKVAPALAAGCTVISKPSELTPFSALALAVLAEEAGVPAGVVNVVTGEAAAIGRVLTEDPRIRKFSFTGSTRVGKILAARCMATVKRVSLELGGNAPFIVFDDAQIDDAVEGLMTSKYRNTGQTCVCANRILVQSHVYDAFAKKLTDRVSHLVVGDALAGDTHQGPLINAAAQRKATVHVEDAMAKGARLLIGGGACEPPGFFFAPTVLADVSPDALLCHEETFGPVAGLIRFTSETEALALANNTSAGLAGYVYTRDVNRSIRVTEQLECGMVGVNTGLISTEVAPFGGIKESGLGREGSRHGIDEYLEKKLISAKVTPYGVDDGPPGRVHLNRFAGV